MKVRMQTNKVLELNCHDRLIDNSWANMVSHLVELKAKVKEVPGCKVYTTYRATLAYICIFRIRSTLHDYLILLARLDPTTYQEAEIQYANVYPSTFVIRISFTLLSNKRVPCHSISQYLCLQKF